MDTTKAATIAKDLMKYHELEGYTFQFDSALRRFGYASWKDKTISLSKHLTELNDENQVLDVILHEIAHILAPKTGHNRLWKAVAKGIGCNGLRCYGNEVIIPPNQYIGTCPACGREVNRLRRKRIACAVCCRGRFQTQYIFTWRKA